VYQAARITSYAIIALAIGGAVTLAGGVDSLAGVRNWILLLAGVYMVLLGVGMTGLVPALRHLSPRPPQALVRWIGRSRRLAAAGAGGLVAPATLGLLAGLMPCAPLIAAQIGAASSGSPLQGAALMAAFGLGTAPALLLLGVASGLVSNALKDKLAYVAAAAVVLFGLVIVVRGLALVGSPVTFETFQRAVVGSPARSGAGWYDEDGTPVFDLLIEDTQFVPSTVTLPTGRASRIVVDRREDAACSDQLAIPQLGVLADLAPNAKTVVEVPAGAAGSYTLTCGMGMMSGTLSLAP
jgi:sulfite exporter TauE/SafE